MRRLQVPLLTMALLGSGCSGGTATEPTEIVLTEGGAPLALRIPAGWERIDTIPASYRAQWRAGGSAGDTAITGVRAAGSKDAPAALDEWRRLFTQEPPGNEKVSNLRFPGRHPMTVIELRGTHAGRPGYALIACAVELPGALHLVDLVGPEPVVMELHEAFHSLLASVRLAK